MISKDSFFQWLYVLAGMLGIAIIVLQFVNIMSLTTEIKMLRPITEDLSLFKFFTKAGTEGILFATLNLCCAAYPMRCICRYFFTQDAAKQYKGHKRSLICIFLVAVFYLLIIDMAEDTYENASRYCNATFELNEFATLYVVCFISLFLLFVLLSMYAHTKRKELQ